MADNKINPTSIPVFENPNITGDYLEGYNVTAATVTAFYSRNIGYHYIRKSTGLIGLFVDCTNGSASDTLLVQLQFNYGTSGTNSWTTKTITLAAAQLCNASTFYRIDINATWRDCIPFDKLRIKFQKTGTNSVVAIKSRLMIA